MPADRIAAFADLARAHDLALIVDETYRTFVPSGEAPHGLFATDDWADTVISLHSFSKEFAIPGHRVGAAVGAPALLDEALKLLDCVAICAPRSGQAAALAGLTHSLEWRAEQVARIAALQADFEAVMADRPGGWELASAGAYFGWVRHPWDCSDQAAVQRLLFELDILAIPGAAFLPGDERMIRMSFANLEPVEIEALGDRLRSV